jgi:hypothetical protein
MIEGMRRFDPTPCYTSEQKRGGECHQGYEASWQKTSSNELT